MNLDDYLKRSSGIHPLHRASAEGHLEIVIELINHYAYINEKSVSAVMPFNLSGLTPLHLASIRNHLEIVKELIKHHASVSLSLINDKDNSGWTALHYASAYNHIKIVKELLKHNANVNATENNGHIPLHFASNNGHIEVVKILIHDSNLSIKDQWGLTALDFATHEIKEFIMDYLISFPVIKEPGYD